MSILDTKAREAILEELSKLGIKKNLSDNRDFTIACWVLDAVDFYYNEKYEITLKEKIKKEENNI